MSSSFPFDQDDARRAQVLRQVEYYFCDENLPYDQFLLRHADPSGAIESSVLANSNRIVEYLPSMSPTERAKVVFDVGARSDSIQQVGDSKLSRRRPLPLDDPAASRSVYARFSKASIHESRTFTIPHRKLREHRETRDFTGEVIFEFETRAASDAFLNNEPDQIEGLVVEELVPCTDFYARRDADTRAKKRKRSHGTTLLAFENARKGLDRETLRDICGPDVAFVTYDRGDANGHVRFATAQAAAAALARLRDNDDNGPETWSKLDAEQEEAYWERVNQRRLAFKKNKNSAAAAAAAASFEAPSSSGPPPRRQREYPRDYHPMGAPRGGRRGVGRGRLGGGASFDRPSRRGRGITP